MMYLSNGRGDGMERILMIEDDIDLMEGVVFYLECEGYSLDRAVCNKEAKEKIDKENYSLLIMDCNLPDGNGFELCREVREYSQIPILMLTARDTEMDEIKALELGVDDFMTKPFSLSVLKARIKNLCRRRENASIINSNGVTIDKGRGKVFKENEEISLSTVEYKLLVYFVENKDQILSKEQILNWVWDQDGKYVDENIVSVNIRRLRMKIEKDSSNPQSIKTVHGMGYIWREKK